MDTSVVRPAPVTPDGEPDLVKSGDEVTTDASRALDLPAAEIGPVIHQAHQKRAIFSHQLISTIRVIRLRAMRLAAACRIRPRALNNQAK